MLRKLCAVHLFSQKALDALRPIRAANVAGLARALRARAQSEGAVSLGQGLNVCTTNALSMALMGRRVFDEDVEGKDAAEFKEMVLERMALSGTFNIGDFVPWLRSFDVQGLVPRMKKVHQRFDTFLNKVVEDHKRVKLERDDDDLLSELLRLVEEEGGDHQDEKLTITNIKALLQNLFLAGTDTTSSTVEWAMSELIRHPDSLKKAQSELDTVVGRDRLVRETDLPDLPYLQAVVKETFRLHPATPLSLPHMASESCQVNGYRIPANATVLVNVWGIARDPAIWTDPLEFCPGRFLAGGGYENVDVKGNDFGLIPFGAGRRICVGLSLGVRMVQLLTATLVHAFDWKLPRGQNAGSLDMEEAFGLTLQRAVPLVVVPVPRLAQEAYETEV